MSNISATQGNKSSGFGGLFGSLGADAVIENIAFEKVKKKAIEQGTWYIIFNNYKKLFEKQYTDEKAIQYIENENKKILLSVCRDIRKKEVLKDILSDCKNSGIKCILLKGFFFAQFIN